MTASCATDKTNVRSRQMCRRDFLAMLGISAGSAWLNGCERTWSVPAHLVEMALRGPGLETEQASICGLCPSGCGIRVRLVDGLPVGIKGNPRHPINQGGLCPVGHAGLELLYSPERLQSPVQLNSNGERRAIGWDQALSDITDRLSSFVRSGEGHRVAILSDEPGRLFHDLAVRFAGALGSSSVSRASLDPVLGYTLTQGVTEIPGFDLGSSDLVLSFGLDLFEDGPSPMLAIASMIGQRDYGDRAGLIHVGTRLSPSASRAQERLAIQPGTFAAAALGIAHVLVREGNVDRRFIAEHTFGYSDWSDGDGTHHGFERFLLENYYPDRAARLCGCSPMKLISVARRLAAAERPVALAGGEAVCGSDATYTIMAVHVLNALLGAFDRPGGIVIPTPIAFSKMEEIQTPSQPSVFAPSVNELGVDPVRTLASGILEGSSPIDLLFVVSTNPVHDSPHGEALREAMNKVSTVVVMSSFLDDTAACADYVLPPPTYLETWQAVDTPPGTPFSVLGIGSPVIEPLYDTRHPADVLLDLARRTSPEISAALPWPTYVDYVKDRLGGIAASGQGSVISGTFEESWVHFLEERGWRFLQHEGIDSLWKGLIEESGWWNPVRTEGDWSRMLPTSSGRFEFHSRVLARHLESVGEADLDAGNGSASPLDRAAIALGLQARGDELCFPHHELTEKPNEDELVLVPFRPITGRGRLGTMSPMVLAMYGYSALTSWQTWVELSPETAHHLHLHDGDTARIESSRGSIEAIVRVQAGAVTGVANICLGLGHDNIELVAGGIGSNPMAIITSHRDPLSGSTSLCSTQVRLHLIQRRKHGGPPPADGGHA